MKRAFKECILAARPGVTNAVAARHFEVREGEIDISKVGDGCVICETKYLTVDPYMRCMFDEGHPQLGEYLTTFKLGEPLSGGGVGTVIASDHPEYKEGDTLCMPFQGYPWATVASISPAATKAYPVQPEMASHYLGALGIPGLTAYFGFYEGCKVDGAVPGEGKVVVVSGAAGATGSVFCQLARSHECTVVGICGSEEKCEYLRSLGVVAVNYKAPTFKGDLEAALPTGADIYFDNVGGTVSDLVIANMNPGGVIPICGQIAVYSEDVPYPPPLSPALQAFCGERNINRFRYLCLNYEDRFPEAVAHLGRSIAAGKLIPKETITEGFCPHLAFIDMMGGGNIGKAVVKI